MGFSVPIHEWLRGPMKGWSEDLLNKERIKKEGYFNELIVEKSGKNIFQEIEIISLSYGQY